MMRLTDTPGHHFLHDLDAYPDEMLEVIAERIGIDEAYERATESARV